MGDFKDEVKKLLGLATTQPEPTPVPEPQPEPAPQDPAAITEPPAPEQLTPETVSAMITDAVNKERETMAADMAEVLKSFKGDDTPATGTPAAPVGTADFSEWNKEIAAIEERNN